MTAEDVMDRLLDFGIKPFFAEIERILRAGDFPVIAHEPGELGQQALAVLGRRGDAECFGVSRTRMRKTVGQADEVTMRWVSAKPRPGHIKVFVVAHAATFLVNFAPGIGWYLEPGSTDAERAAP